MYDVTDMPLRDHYLDEDSIFCAITNAVSDWLTDEDENPISRLSITTAATIA